MKKKQVGTVRIRPAIEDDIPFIFSTWLKSFRDSFFAQNISTTIYYAEHHKVVERLLKSCSVYVACDDNDLSQLYGYICAEEIDGIFVLHYVYVKHSFRWLGIGRQLLNAFSHDATRVAIYTHCTKVSRALGNKFNLVHSPYIALTAEYRKEDAKALSKQKKEELYGNDAKESVEQPALQRPKRLS